MSSCTWFVSLSPVIDPTHLAFRDSWLFLLRSAPFFQQSTMVDKEPFVIVPFESLTILREIGCGAYARVYRVSSRTAGQSRPPG